MIKTKTVLFALFFSALLLSIIPATSHAAGDTVYEKAAIYYNRACHDCTMYIENTIEPMLEEYNLEIEKKDYINKKENRVELNELSRGLGVPIQLQGHFTIFIDNKVILQGHVPKQIIRDLLESENADVFDRIIVFQDEMDENAATYKVWALKGEIKEYDISEPISTYLDWFVENGDSLETPEELLQTESLNAMYILPLILVTGLLDGINPCAFAVLLFFIAFLFTIKKTKTGILKMGSVYIFAIFMAYLLIGLGLLQALLLTGEMHLMAKIAAYLIILLGLLHMISYFFPKFPIKLKIPGFSKKTIHKWMHKSTLPAALVLGFLVGLCTFPCSGGIYVAVIGLLAAKTTYFQGLMYLLLYNIMFVTPLIAILLGASSKRVTNRMTGWEQSKSRAMHLLAAIVMIVMGIIILTVFV